MLTGVSNDTLQYVTPVSVSVRYPLASEPVLKRHTRDEELTETATTSNVPTRKECVHATMSLFLENTYLCQQ